MIRFLILTILYGWMAIAEAANPAIIFGADGMAKNLASGGVELSNGVRWLDLAADPSVGGVTAPLGSMGADSTTGIMYIKTGATDTDWEAISHYVTPITTQGDIVVGDISGLPVRLAVSAIAGQVLTSTGSTLTYAAPADELPLLPKGGLVTSNGTVNGSFSACDDDQILIWDSLEDSGLRCTAIPSQTPTLAKGEIIVGTDTSDVSFPAGADGQVIVYDSSTSTGLSSVTFSSSPTTTKGDLIVRGDSADERLPIGSAGQVLKVDTGGSTFTFDAPPYLGLLGKGSIITSDGTTNGEFTACGDGQILEYDSATASGIKCVTKPTFTADPVNYQKSSSSGNYTTTNAGWNDVTNLSVTVTTTGNPVFLKMVPDNTTNASEITSTGLCFIRLIRDATMISQNSYFSTDLQDTPSTLDVIGEGTYTYKIQTQPSGSVTCRVKQYQLVAWEIK